MNDIQQSRLWVIGGAVATIVILLMGYLLLISPQLTTAETIRGDTQLALDRNTAMEARITQLRAANENLDELQTDLEAARRELPVRNETEVFASTLQNLGEKNLVSVTSISFGDPENVTSRAQGTVAAAPDAAATDESDAATAADAAATAAAEAQARQTFALPVTFSVEGPATAVDAFVSEVQGRGQRATAIVTSVVNPVAGVVGGSISGDVVATYTGYVFLSPLDAAAAAELFGTSSGG